MATFEIIPVKTEHIQRGIDKYNGVIDNELKRHINNAQLDYVPYVFDDGRVLMVLEIIKTAFLYPSKQAVYETLLQ